MPKIKYSLTQVNDEATAKSMGKDLDLSLKKTRELCKLIKGMHIDKAKKTLRNIIEKRQAVPFKRFRSGAGHKKNLQKWDSGRYPAKSAKEVLKVIENAEANAEDKGLELEKLWVKHVLVKEGPKLERVFYRAMGRSTPKIRRLVHLEVILEEREGRE